MWEVKHVSRKLFQKSVKATAHDSPSRGAVVGDTEETNNTGEGLCTLTRCSDGLTRTMGTERNKVGCRGEEAIILESDDQHGARDRMRNVGQVIANQSGRWECRNKLKMVLLLSGGCPVRLLEECAIESSRRVSMWSV